MQLIEFDYYSSTSYGSVDKENKAKIVINADHISNIRQDSENVTRILLSCGIEYHIALGYDDVLSELIHATKKDEK